MPLEKVQIFDQIFNLTNIYFDQLKS